MTIFKKEIRIELTASQIETIEEIELHKRLSRETLEVALEYHSKTRNKVIRKEDVFWKDLLTTNNLNEHKNKKWMIDTIEGKRYLTKSK